MHCGQRGIIRERREGHAWSGSCEVGTGLRQLRRDDVEAGNGGEVTDIEGGDRGGVFERTGGKNQIMGTDHSTGNLTFSPNSSVDLCCSLGVRNHGKHGKENFFQEPLSAHPVHSGSTFNSVAEFSDGDRRQYPVVWRLRVYPRKQIEPPAFGMDQNVGVDQDCHLSTTGGRFSRASSRSRSQASASSLPRRNFFRASDSA